MLVLKRHSLHLFIWAWVYNTYIHTYAISLVLSYSPWYAIGRRSIHFPGGKKFHRHRLLSITSCHIAAASASDSSSPTKAAAAARLCCRGRRWRCCIASCWCCATASATATASSSANASTSTAAAGAGDKFIHQFGRFVDHLHGWFVLFASLCCFSCCCCCCCSCCCILFVFGWIWYRVLAVNFCTLWNILAKVVVFIFIVLFKANICSQAN